MKGLTGKLKERVKRKETLIAGCVMDSRSGAVMEMYQDCGYDMALIDREHTALNSETILEQIRIARALDLPCMVRAADSSYHEACRFLDQGADGIFMPRIHSKEEAENFIRNVKYPPLGVRGLGASTCPAGKYMGWNHVKDMVEFFNENLVVGIQIETAGAIADLDGILSLPGIDVAVVGNDDLSLGMGIVGELESREYIDAVMRMIDTCEKHNVLPGIACGDPERVHFWHDRGMRLFWATADICLMWSAAQNQMANIQAALKGLPYQSTGCHANI